MMSNDGMLMGAALPSTPRTTVFPQPWTIPKGGDHQLLGHLHFALTLHKILTPTAAYHPGAFEGLRHD